MNDRAQPAPAVLEVISPKRPLRVRVTLSVSCPGLKHNLIITTIIIIIISLAPEYIDTRAGTKRERKAGTRVLFACAQVCREIS
jgi:hypothetical protein